MATLTGKALKAGLNGAGGVRFEKGLDEAGFRRMLSSLSQTDLMKLDRQLEGQQPAEVAARKQELIDEELNRRYACGKSWSPEKSLPAFLKAVKDKKSDYIQDTWGERTKTAMSNLSGTVGGYTIPQDFNDQILKTIDEESFIRQRACIIGMNSLQTYCPIPDFLTTPSAVGVSATTGGMTFDWGDEGTTINESEPAFGQLALRAWDLVGYVKISNQLLADITPTTEQFLMNLFARATAFAQQYAFFQGKGTNRPLGLLNAPALITQTRSGGNKVAASDIAGMAGSMLPSAWRTAVWATHPATLPQIATISTYFLTGETNDDGYCGTLMGRPLYITECLPTLGTTGDLMFFDPRLYVIGDRMTLAIDASPDFLFTTNQTAFRIWCRLDGQPLVQKSITLADTSTKVSPYIALHS